MNNQPRLGRLALPTVTSVMWHPTPELRARWLRQYGRDRFTFEEAREAQSFPPWWLFPGQKSKRWKWLAEAFPPRVAEHLLSNIEGNNLVLLDLYSGIGGWGLGAVWTGKFKRVIMVENDREKCKYLKLNFSKLNVDFEVVCKDARTVDYGGLGRVDVVTASPPCEDLTVLKFFNYNPTNRGTIPLTLLADEVVKTLRPRAAFYENVYRKPLRGILESRGWRCRRFDMSRIIPQRRVRLLCTRP